MLSPNEISNQEGPLWKVAYVIVPFVLKNKRYNFSPIATALGIGSAWWKWLWFSMIFIQG